MEFRGYSLKWLRGMSTSIKEKKFLNVPSKTNKLKANDVHENLPPFGF